MFKTLASFRLYRRWCDEWSGRNY